MKASLAMIGSAVCYSLQYMDIKRQALDLTSPLSLWEASFYRGLSGAVIAFFLQMLLWVWNSSRPFWGREKKALHIRGMIGGLSFLGTIFALRHLSLSTATTALSLSPMWTACCSPLLFRRQPHTAPRPVNRVEIFGIALCLVGLGLLGGSLSSFESLGMVFGLFAALGSTLCQSVVNLSISSVSLKDESPFLLSLYPMLYTVLLSLPGGIHKRSWRDMMRLSTTGVTADAAQVLRVVALQNSRRVGITIWRFLDVPLSLLFERWILGSNMKIPMMEMGGMICIFIGCILPPLCSISHTALNPPVDQKTGDEEEPSNVVVVHVPSPVESGTPVE